MPPPSDHRAFNLKVHPKPFFVKQLPSSEKVSSKVLEALNSSSAGFFSITRTPEEVSIVGGVDEFGSVLELLDGDWRCIQIAGPMDFGLTGVLCNLSTPLKAANIPIYALSTWNTDYVLVPKGKLGQAVLVLKEDGWSFLTG